MTPMHTIKNSVNVQELEKKRNKGKSSVFYFWQISSLICGYFRLCQTGKESQVQEQISKLPRANVGGCRQNESQSEDTDEVSKFISNYYPSYYILLYTPHNSKMAYTSQKISCQQCLKKELNRI